LIQKAFDTVQFQTVEQSKGIMKSRIEWKTEGISLDQYMISLDYANLRFDIAISYKISKEALKKKFSK
tara:strand:+ start:167 stop:370 length:204 start_codon:yes stop_codon:yes gene_type:complete